MAIPYVSENDVIQTRGQDGIIPVNYLYKVVAIREQQEWINPMYSLGLTRQITLHDLNIDWLDGAHRMLHDFATPEPLGRAYPGHAPVHADPPPPRMGGGPSSSSARYAPAPRHTEFVGMIQAEEDQQNLL